MLDRVTVQADADQLEELEPILRPAQNSQEKKPQSQLPVEEVLVTIEKTAYEEIQEAISALKLAKFKSQSWHHSPYMAGGLLLALSITGIFLSALTIDKYNRRWGVQPEALKPYRQYAGYYNDSANSPLIAGICDQYFPLKNVCKNLEIVSPALEDQCHNSHVNCTLHDLARECFVLADELCKRMGKHDFNIPQWQNFVMGFACAGLLIGVCLTIWRSRCNAIHNTNHMNSAARASMNLIAAKYELSLDYQTIDHAVAQLEKKAEEVSRPVRRRAFLSAVLEEHKEADLHRFFKGVEKSGVQSNDASKNPFASTDIKRKILDYAGLMPQARLGR